MPPNTVVSAGQLETIEATQAPTNTDGDVTYIGPQSKRCRPDLHRASLRTPPFPLRTESRCRQKLKRRHKLRHKLRHNLRWLGRRGLCLRLAEVPEGPDRAKHRPHARLALLPTGSCDLELRHRAVLPARQGRMLGPHGEPATASPQVLVGQFEQMGGLHSLPRCP